jgi:hypothetical protein
VRLWNVSVPVSLQNKVLNVLMMIIGSLHDLFLFWDVCVLQNVLYTLPFCINFHIFVPVPISSICYSAVDITEAPVTVPVVLVLLCRGDSGSVFITFTLKCLYEAGVLLSKSVG